MESLNISALFFYPGVHFANIVSLSGIGKQPSESLSVWIVEAVQVRERESR